MLEDMLTKVELKHLVEAGENVLQDFKNLAELKEAQKNRNLSLYSELDCFSNLTIL